MTTEKKIKKEHQPNDRVTGSLSLLYRQWQELKKKADQEGLSMSVYVATKLKL
jgi:hypothetical protein